jgi:hypothetical protein
MEDASMNAKPTILLALVSLGLALPGRAVALTPEVRDRAGMFSKKAVAEADRFLRDIERDSGWQVIIETVPSLDGKPIEQRALANAKALKVHGLYILISKDDHKLWVEPSRSAEEVFTKPKVHSLVRRMEAAFHARDFDEGLSRAVGEIRDDIKRAPSLTDPDVVKEPVPEKAAGPPPFLKPVVVPPEETKSGPPIGSGKSTPSLRGLLFVCGGVLVALWLIGKLFRGKARNAGDVASMNPGAPIPSTPPMPGPGPVRPAGPQQAPRPGPPPGYGGQPGYGPAPGSGPPQYPTGPGYAVPPQAPQGGGGGGGFVSGALGGLGGAVLGNILYDKFGRPHPGQEIPPGGTGAGAFPHPEHGTGDTAWPPDSAPPQPPAESYDPDAGAGGDWGSPDPAAGPAETAWSGGDASPGEASPDGGGQWVGADAAGAGGDWGAPDPSPSQDDPGAGGDWGEDAAPSPDEAGDGGGDWGDSGGNDDNQGGSW